MPEQNTLSPNQDIAADPNKNIWVQANAGTGKTSVLVQRLLRILFNSKPDTPTGILCLTYTNAAAAEMRNRILKELQHWALASDKELEDLLISIKSTPFITSEDIQRAKTIFFEYIDNPNVLKIKTIHSFCEEILRRFPIEAHISPNWTLVSDEYQSILLQDCFERLVNTQTTKDTHPVILRAINAFTHLLNRITDSNISDLFDIVLNQYTTFFYTDKTDTYRKYFIENTQYYLNLHDAQQYNKEIDKLQNIIEYTRNVETGQKYLNDIITKTNLFIENAIDFKEYATIYLNTNGEINHNIQKHPVLLNEANTVYQHNQFLINQEIYKDSLALFDLCAAFVQTYQQVKRQHNLLDFNDIILYTKQLFSEPSVMGWVLSQLDISLNHILIDEAQDTSPEQWDILKLLIGEFFTEASTKQKQYSIFVVGDTKQSIYSFQGADPQAFNNTFSSISSQLQHYKQMIQEIPLEKNFRSVKTILSVVDYVFDNEYIKQQTGFINNKHLCNKGSEPGIVELFKTMSTDQETGTTSLDFIRQIVDKIKELITLRHYKAKDIMILVKNRKPFADILISELKRNNIEVAGSDRINLPNYPAIKDLLNLIRFCINTTDDYRLCCVLKSPLFAFHEQQIFDLCKNNNDYNTLHKNNQPRSIYELLQTQYPEIYNQLDNLIANAKSLGPYTFFCNLINNNNIKQQMIKHLGNQIIEPLEEFLTICLSYERTETGTLYHFLKWFMTSNSIIKRDTDTYTGIRVMTVHGSKGLQSKIVFLIDTAKMPQKKHTCKIPSYGDTSVPTWIWVPRKTNSVQQTKATQYDSAFDLSEYYRLLYVAMTRATHELYIYGYSNTALAELCWYNQLSKILQNYPNATITDKSIKIE